MKMKVALNLLPVILLLVFTLQSCQKELSPETTTTPTTPTTPDSNYIAKIYTIEVVNGVADTGYIMTYYYDNLKRVVSIFDSAKNLYNYTQSKYNYFYINNDSLPYKSTVYSVNAYYPTQTVFYYDTTITYHFYDNAGKNLKDSIIFSTYRVLSTFSYFSILELRDYSYGTGKIYGHKTFFPIVNNSGAMFYPQKDTAIVNASGNIIDYKNYEFNPSSSLFELSATSVFTYDAKPSPFSKLSNFKTFGVFPSGETLFYELPQYNNRLTQNEHHSFLGGGSGVYYNTTFSNSYNANGLVKEMLIYDVPPDPANFVKVTFVYKSL